jgi:hypothetical protein
MEGSLATDVVRCVVLTVVDRVVVLFVSVSILLKSLSISSLLPWDEVTSSISSSI